MRRSRAARISVAGILLGVCMAGALPGAVTAGAAPAAGAPVPPPGAAPAAGAAVPPPAAAPAVPPPDQDPFYRYHGPHPLKDLSPGTVLKTRVLPAHIAGIPLPVTAVQLLYRSTSELGQPTVNVTSVLQPPSTVATPKLIAYQSFYDSLDRDDEPSYSIAGGVTFGGLIPDIESLLLAPELQQGYTVVIADVEGQRADFGAGPEYGMNTLDSIRAALASPATGLTRSTEVGLIGYSGGAIATEWAAELAHSYAPDIAGNIVGLAMGGVLVDPAHNMRYVDGSQAWASVIPMAVIGLSRAFGVDLRPYLSTYGMQVFKKLKYASIAQVLGAYPGLTWARLTKPQYGTPESVPSYVQVTNQLIMGTGGTPTAPLFIGQGADGELEGTSGEKPGIGEGDGVMVAGDVRSLAREYCGRGVAVQYVQYDDLSHVTSTLPWLPAASAWLLARFAGAPAPTDCATIPPGNPLTPIH